MTEQKVTFGSHCILTHWRTVVEVCNVATYQENRAVSDNFRGAVKYVDERAVESLINRQMQIKIGFRIPASAKTVTKSKYPTLESSGYGNRPTNLVACHTFQESVSKRTYQDTFQNIRAWLESSGAVNHHRPLPAETSACLTG